MIRSNSTAMLPPCRNTSDGHERRVGVEIELAGIGGEELAESVANNFDGTIQQQTRYEFLVSDTQYGDFKLELDSQYIKKLEREAEDKKAESGNADADALVTELENISSDLMSIAAEQFVPWEIVTPPIPLSSLSALDPLVTQLREHGAKGTRHAIRFAFGVHLNPDLPALDSDTILRYLKAYCCLYDWILDREKVDVSRRLTPYINHFKRDYIAKVIASDYAPDLETLIDDYLHANPTRNRSLDLLPLFAHLDESRVRAVIDDPRIKPRPTFHYRLPNCDIDNPDWGVWFAWNNWLQVEMLAENQQRLKEICAAYGEDLNRLTGQLDKQWLQRCKQWIENEEWAAE